MFDPNQIDTNGFPYLAGLEPRIYLSVPIPESEQQCNEMIKHAWEAIRDIQLQLKIRQDDTEWKIAAYKKLRTFNQQKRLLEAQRDIFIAERGQNFEKANISRLRSLEEKIEGVIRENERLRHLIHRGSQENNCYRAVLTRLLLELEKGTLENFVKVNQEYIDYCKETFKGIKEGYGKMGKWENGEFITDTFL